MNARVAALAAALLGSVTSPARADEDAPRPYSIPWQLRPVVAPTVVRAETSIARYGPFAATGVTGAFVLTAAARIPGTGPPSAGLAPVVRVAMAGDRAADGNATVVLSNPLLGAAYAWRLDDGVRLNVFGGIVMPLGTDDPARARAANARAQFDNALFAVHDVTFAPGFSAAWTKNDATLQGEMTLFHLVRTHDGAQPEATKTAMTCGLHVGWFASPRLSFGAEIRYQRWLNAPFAVAKSGSAELVDNVAFAIGPRLHLPLSEHVLVRPGIAYHHALDLPLGSAPINLHIVQIDLPFFAI